MDNQEIKNRISQILRHEAPVVFGDVAPDVKEMISSLKEAGDNISNHIVSAVKSCASGASSGPYWWNGAQELCALLAAIRSEAAKDALLSILRMDSNIHEFQYVRSSAAAELNNFNDDSIVPLLLEISKMPNAPASAIMKTIESLGYHGDTPPQAIIDKGISINSPVEKVQYFEKYLNDLHKWPIENQAAFWWFLGNAVEAVHGQEKALPYFAAGLSTRPSPQAAAWGKFRNVTPSPESAKNLAKKYPFPKDGTSTTTLSNLRPANIDKKWWQFWR